jgi:hypothetical protein
VHLAEAIKRIFRGLDTPAASRMSDRPKDGNLVAVLPGADPNAKAVMLLAHIDVVEAKREDWERDPFKLTEENGYFYARGSADDKAMAAIFTDMMVRYKEERYRPRRALKYARGEETPNAQRRASWSKCSSSMRNSHSTRRWRRLMVMGKASVHQPPRNVRLTLETVNQGGFVRPSRVPFIARRGIGEDPGVRAQSTNDARAHSAFSAITA